MIRMLRCLLAVTLLASAPQALFGQSTYASITGVITDSTGAVLPNAEVEAVESGSGYRYTSQSNESGTYTLPQLREGTYRVHVSHTGLADWILEGVQLKARDVRRLDVTLRVASVDVQVDVTGAVALIETESARISDTKDRAYIRALPATVRRPWDFVNLVPQTRVSSFNAIRYAGSRIRQGEPAQDGMVLSRSDGAILSRSLDYTEMYSEIRIDSAGNSAEFATLGQMNMMSRGGSNEWHGNVHDFFTTPGLMARNTFSPIQTITKPNHKAGGSIGGPVILPKLYNGKNRTFFMFTTQFTKSRGERVLVNPTVPLPGWREGDFSGLLPTVINDPLTNSPFPGNKIPLARLNPVSLKLQEFYPLPNQPIGSQLTSQNFRANDFRPNYALPGYNGRVDHRFSDKSSFFVRYFQTWWILQSPGSDSRNLPLPKVPLVQSYDDTRSFMASHTYTFTPSIVNEVRGQFSFSKSWLAQPLNGKDGVTSLGLQGLVNDLPDLGGYPNINFSNIGLTQLTFPYSTDPGRRDRALQIQDHVSWFKGTHTIKFGAQFSRYSTYSFTQNSGLFGNVTFSNRYTGNTYADFLLGIPTSVSRSFVKPADDIQRKTFGFFFTDDYKISPKLTLSLGVRYDLLQPFSHTSGLLSAFDIKTGNIVVPDSSLSKVGPVLPTGYVKVIGASAAGYPQNLISTDRNNIAPRIAVAWRPIGPNTVFRGGFGIYYDVVPTQLSTTGVPFVITEPDFTNPAVNPTVIFPQVFPATSTGAPRSVTLPAGVRSDIRIPYSMQYTATIEHAVKNTAIRLSYVGTNTRQGVYGYDYNQPVPDTRLYVDKPRPFPLYPNITYLTNGAGHQYHGGSISVSRRSPLHGFQWDVMYTLARDIGDLDNAQSPENAFDRRRERSAWTDIPTHRAVGIFMYDLPFGKGRAFGAGANRWMNMLIGDWKVTSKNSFESGLFFTPFWTGPDPTGTAFTSSSTPAQVTIRPNQIANPALDNPTKDRWFNPAAFTAPTPGYFGSASKGAIIGPNLVALGASLQKYITIKERVTVRLELLTNNWLNHPNYAQPAANISNTGSVGVISSQSLDGIKQDDAGPRRVLLHLRIEF